MRPSPAISPLEASAHHCAFRYAQSSPTYFTSGLLPDGIGHRRVSPARRPFFMTFHKRSIRATAGGGQLMTCVRLITAVKLCPLAGGPDGDLVDLSQSPERV